MVRKGGYHRRFAGGAKLDLPLQDPVFGYVMVPMAEGLRLTTGAELSGREASSKPIQVVRAEMTARKLLDLATAAAGEPWIGVRPGMPIMLPVFAPPPGP